ncbi:m-AAA protease-interacting protein 1, mitochondrial [Anopheles marshallii]|uniref:m-AAA protease-interacting protein 1, mitochondrial n=1 Tax=Anopheles marshallii TaxID=1521116 RepID=UPI00237B943A|nr:m-AAA protease-interacting protein 1, mitochondrial [Anopheles marshallii]
MFVVQSGVVKFKLFTRSFHSFSRFYSIANSHKVVGFNLPLCVTYVQRTTAVWSPGTNGLLSGSSVVNNNNHNIVQTRWNSTDEQSSRQRIRKPLTLMDFPQLVWPSVIKTIRNWIMVHFIIRPYFDREFALPDFIQGAKQALQVVSSSLAGGEVKQLEGLVDRAALNDLKQSIAKMSVAERYDIQVEKEDVYFSFPYQVGVMFDESNDDSQKRFVEITMVFHVLRGLKGMIERGETVPLNVGVLPEFRDKISICNYRFIKEFTKGVDSDWTVNVVNHFKPSDYVEE